MNRLSNLRSRMVLLTALAALMTCMGCFRSTVRVVVKQDGSGTIAVSQSFDYETIDYLRGDLTREAAMQELFSPERLKRNGSDFGENITMLVGKPTVKADGAGYLAIYRFADLNQVKIPLGKDGEHMRFGYTPGEVTVFPPAQPKGAITNKLTVPTEKERQDALAQLLEQLKQNGNPYKLRGNESLNHLGARMLGTLQATIELDLPPGSDVSTASFPHPQKPNRVTLLNISGESLATTPSALNTIFRPSTSASTLFSIPGVSMETKRELRFRLPQ